MALVNINSEFGRLKKAVFYRPHHLEIDQNDAANAMYIALPDIATVLQEFDNIVSTLTNLGVEVIVLQDTENTTPTSNMIYLRDVATVVGENIFLSNMKHKLRFDEPEKFSKLLIEHDPNYSKYIQRLPDTALVEGADALVLSKKEVVFYTGSRTNSLAREAINSYMPQLKTWEIKANIDGVPQHILGALHIIDKNLATRRNKYCNDTIDNFSYIDFSEDDEITKGFSLNIITIGPREVLMPANRPRTKAKLEKFGITCHEVSIEEIHKMGGGLACMMLPLDRENQNA